MSLFKKRKLVYNEEIKEMLFAWNGGAVNMCKEGRCALDSHITYNADYKRVIRLDDLQ